MFALRLIVAALVPVVLAVLFFLLEKKTKFANIKYIYKEIIIGVTYGIVACLATQYGVPYEKYMLNVRSASPLTAGLIFGAPAGIIAGVIGAVYRFVSVYWGVSQYTQIACSVATLLAGLIGAGFNKYVFKGKRPPCIYGAFIAAITEIFHMLLVFITHMDDIKTAFTVVQETAPLMIAANVASLFITLFLLIFIVREPIFIEKKDRPIVKTFSLYLLISVLLCFIITSVFTYFLQDNVSNYEVEQTLSLNVADLETEINDSVDNELVEITQSLAEKITESSTNHYLSYVPTFQHMQTYCKAPYNLNEFLYVAPNGTVMASYDKGRGTPLYEVGYNINNDNLLRPFLSLYASNDKPIVLDLQPTTVDPTVSLKYSGALLSNGYLIITAYDETRCNEVFLNILTNIADNRHIGQNGFMFVLSNEDASVISAPVKEKESITENAKSFVENLATIQDDVVLTYTVPGDVEYYFMKDAIKEYIVVACMPVSEVDFSRDMSVYIGLFMQSFVFSILIILVYALLKKLIVDNIHKVNNSLTLVTAGELDTKFDIRDNAEFTSLSDDINATVTRLKGYISDAEKRIDMELQFAKSIQFSVIPSVFPPYPNRDEFDIFASMETAKEVGGDFYDFYLVDGKHLAFLMADVSGKGIPAAMFMMNAKSIIKSLTESGLPVSEVMTKTNEKLCASNEAGMFVTAWMGMLNLETGVIKYVNAGHNPPLLKKKDGGYEYIKGRHGFILAGMEGIQYSESELTIAPGDELFLYTDGVTEANNINSELYGENRLSAILNKASGMTATDLCKFVKNDLDEFVGEASQFDDITMMSLRYLKKSNKSDKGAKMVKELSIDATIDHIEAVTDFVDAELEAISCPPKALAQINVAIDELFGNIAHYAYNPDVGKATVQIEVTKDPMSVIITFVDEGIPFDPLSRENPDITLGADEREIGGLGIFMVKKTMDAINYEYKDGKNILTIVKNL